MLISEDPTDDALERVLDQSDDEVKIAPQWNDAPAPEPSLMTEH